MSSNRPPGPALRLRARAPLARLALLTLLSSLLGCASFSPDGGLAPIAQTAHDELGKELLWTRRVADLGADRDRIAQRVAELSAQPLTADAAVQIALLNNAGLQASLQNLGIAEAELVQASRLPNPGFSLGRLRRAEEREIERTLSFDLGHLLALPLRRPLEQRRFAAVQRGVALDMLNLAAQARRAWVLAVAAEQSQRYQAAVQTNAAAGAELARRMGQAGNWNKLQQAREQGFAAEAALNLARAAQTRLATRERLTRLLGLARPDTFTLPERLPELPAAPAERPAIEQAAMARRLDVQAAQLQTEATARNLGLTKATRFINVFEFSAQRNTSNEAPSQTGYEISLEIPLFDWSGARVAKAEAIYLQSVQRAAQVAVEARSEVREAYAGWRASYDIAALYRDQIVPNAQRISEENLLRYNGMLIGVFELLADARAQVASVNGAVQALRDFWLAQAELDLAMLGRPSLPTLAGPSASVPVSGNPGAGH